MAFEARLATVGYVDGELKAEIDLLALHARRLTLFGVSNKMRSAEQRGAGGAPVVKEVMRALSAGRIRAVVDKVYPFSQLAEARAHMEANRQTGKIVVTMEESGK
jgi:NADPH:quinone reductase-like Zn-dependent oxidoreductase